MSYHTARYAIQRAEIEKLNQQHVLLNRAGVCLKAATASKARRLRFAQLGIVEGQHPHGFTPDVSCGDPLCVAKAHVYLRRWKLFKDDGWRLGVGYIGAEKRKRP